MTHLVHLNQFSREGVTFGQDNRHVTKSEEPHEIWVPRVGEEEVSLGNKEERGRDESSVPLEKRASLVL